MIVLLLFEVINQGCTLNCCILTIEMGFMVYTGGGAGEALCQILGFSLGVHYYGLFRDQQAILLSLVLFK